MQHFCAYLVQLVDLYTMLIYLLWGSYRTELQKQSAVPFASSKSSCNVPLVHFLIWYEKKNAYVFLSILNMEQHQKNNLITSLLIPNSEKSDKYFEPVFTVTCFSASSSPCTLWKGRHASLLEKEGCCLPTNKSNSAMYIWMRPQGTTQYILKKIGIISTKPSYLTGN